eukprot:c4766_g1_i1 orf=385-819(-)
MKQDAPSQSGGYSSYYYPQAAPTFYGTFKGRTQYPQLVPPGFPHPVHPSLASGYAYQTVAGYPAVEGAPVDRPLERLPCCGIGIGWFLFIAGFLLVSIPWYVGAFILLCMNHDYRERIGFVCCTIAAILSLVATLIGTRHAHAW